MCAAKSRSIRERTKTFSVERSPDLTVLRFHGRRRLAGFDLGLISELWDFFDAERHEPARVLAVLVPDDLLSPRNLERLLVAQKTDRAGIAVEIRERIMREGNVIQRFIESVRALDSFVVGVAGGNIALRLAAPVFACDYRVVSSKTVFLNMTQDLPHAPLGCLPWLLTRLVGGAKTMQLMLDVPRLSAAEAHDLGLVNHLAIEDRLEETGLEIAERLATLPRATLFGLKQAMVASCEDFHTYLEKERNWTEKAASFHCDGA